MNENKDLNNINENIDNSEEILENEELINEPENVTREINLDDLYDGAVNNTVVIDPVTNNEVLLSNKKPNFTLLGIVLAVLILLVLYYVNNKSDIGRTTTDVEPQTTVTITVLENKEVTSGTLTCTYSSKSDAESQSVTYLANYEDSKIKNSNFNFVVMSNVDSASAVMEDLKTQYETFFINNASLKGNNVTYEKDDKSFTFNIETNYEEAGFTELVMVENQTILFVKPSSEDTIESLQTAYTNKGFSCSLTSVIKGK